MPDEAAGTWIEMADGLSLGHRLLTSVLGPAAVPRVGWQIDPFGHSAVSPGRRERRGPPCPFPSPPPPSDDGHCLHAHGRPVRHVRAACPGILPLHSRSLPPPPPLSLSLPPPSSDGAPLAGSTAALTWRSARCAGTRARPSTSGGPRGPSAARRAASPASTSTGTTRPSCPQTRRDAAPSTSTSPKTPEMSCTDPSR